ncbi:hypothetical protein C8R44DRAFT_975860 [Mycena epipterygia]|nr:hypothetical protein C8R44DRAFT_975860 [Mycena epipterygia]
MLPVAEASTHGHQHGQLPTALYLTAILIAVGGINGRYDVSTLHRQLIILLPFFLCTSSHFCFLRAALISPPGAVLHAPSTIMHTILQRLPAERARHRKRLPFQGRPDTAPLARAVTVIAGITVTGPITITQIIPINTAATATTTTTSSTTTPLFTGSDLPTETFSGLPITTPSTTPSAPVAPSAPAAPPAPSAPAVVLTSAQSLSAPVASASAINPGPSATEGQANSNGIAGVSTQHGLPTGAIVGITIACVLLVLGAFVFFIRQRALRNRKLHRNTAPWMGRPTNSSFEPRAVGASAFPPSTGAGNMGETSPGVSFARAQAQALAVRAPVPNMPAPMPSSYNNPTPAPGAVPAGAASAMVRYEFIPTLPDELSITTGERVRVLDEYDDGWALCANARGDQGMVPLECLDRGGSAALQVTDPQDYRDSRRTSSLGVRY